VNNLLPFESISPAPCTNLGVGKLLKGVGLKNLPTPEKPKPVLKKKQKGQVGQEDSITSHAPALIKKAHTHTHT
jgi:hypothetical protein